MKKEIGKPVFFVILVIVIAIICWVGWNSMKTPYERGLDEKSLFLAAEARAKAHGIDIRTVPNVGALYYKYHPNEKPPPPGSAPAGASAALPPMPGPSTMPAPGSGR